MSAVPKVVHSKLSPVPKLWLHACMWCKSHGFKFERKCQSRAVRMSEISDKRQAGTCHTLPVWLADGFHRVYAAKQAGLVSLPVELCQGTQRDAILFSVGANAKHGKRRTNADKRQAVERLLRDDEWREWSNRQIAEQCAVSLDLVNRIRHELSERIVQMDTRLAQRNGTTYPINTGNIGKRPPLHCRVRK